MDEPRPKEPDWLAIQRVIMRGPWFAKFLILGLLAGRAAGQTNANRLVHLDENDPFSVGLTFPKLTTPQWIGEPGVEAVVVLAIDDMRDPQKYETFLRPVLDRLKAIDGRAPVSIFCNQLDPQNPQLQMWLREGLSFEVHTLTHPCPLLANGNFTAAATNYHDCVDLLSRMPGSRPVAFRMPCCDSMNSPSPRFYAEMFNHLSKEGRFLMIDSSVMNITTTNDPSLPRGLAADPNGAEKFRKYLPTETNAITKLSLKWFGTTIEDYPYPYVIGKLCWEFPPMIPSDWEANNTHGPTNWTTVDDWKAALDATVIKQGVFTFIFHPHGWIRPDQLAAFIDYADKKYGKKVKFLNLREAQERLDKNLLLDEPLRAANGQDNGVRLLDLNNDGYIDVVIGNERVRKTRLWDPAGSKWIDSNFPTPVTVAGVDGHRAETGLRFGIVDADGNATALVKNESTAGAWHFNGREWVEEPALLSGLEVDGVPVLTSRMGLDTGVRFRDIDNSGRCELMVSNGKQNGILAWSSATKSWEKLPFALPDGIRLINDDGLDKGLRFVDINDDGHDDLVVSNEKEFALHMFIATPKEWLGWGRGWTFKVASGASGQPGAIPMIARGGANPNNGVWFHGKQMWVQNEDTAQMPDKVDRRSYAQLLSLAEPPPKSPAESLAAIRVRPGFKVELVANEPLVIDPVAFDWGPDGKLWVVEMRDYPLGMDGHGKPGGVIKYLEDTDGDGRYDKATVFLEGVNFPNGIMVWRKGVLISAAPEIFYAEDTDGDGKADVRKPILVGFNQGNQQHRVNGFEYGLDHWVYAANGGSGGSIRSELTGKTANIRGHDLRFNPDTGDFELIEGQTQFGRHRDDYGRWFGNENPTWLWHYFLPERYLARNPDLAVTTTKRVLANYQNPTRVFPISHPQQRFNWPDAANNVTSANSATPYRDTLFGPEFATSVFASEPAQNVVHREILEPNGVTFTSHRAADEQDKEFLASSDNWFRPTMLKTGPDGALYIADIYRLVIEHPEYFPDELKKRPDLRAGDDKGRLYRVYPEGAKLRPVPRLDRLSPPGLAEKLRSVNGWERDMAERLLIWRGLRADSVKYADRDSKDNNAKGQIQLLSTLDGLGMLTPRTVRDALADVHPEVREFAVRLAEPFLRGSFSDAVDVRLAAMLQKLVDDPAIRVRSQLAFSFGEWNDPRAGATLARIALRDWDNNEIQIAVLSSASNHFGGILESLFVQAKIQPPPAGLVAQLIGMASKRGDEKSTAQILSHVTAPAGAKYALWQMAALAGFLDALNRRGITLEQYNSAAGQELKRQIGRFDGLFAQAGAQVDSASRMSGSTDSAPVLTSIRLLARSQESQGRDIIRLGALLQPQFDNALQQAALAALKQVRDSGVAKALVGGWTSYGPALRLDALNLLLSRPEWVKELVAALQSGTIAPAELGPVYQQQLLKNSDESIREGARKLFAARKSDRQKIVRDYAPVAGLTGNPERGAGFYRQNCSPCHRLKGEGNNVGPDLGTVADKPLSLLLEAIFDPNQAFETKYTSYNAVTRDGREISGIIAAETPNSVTMRNAGGKDEIILRSDIKELNSARLSLMPEGFENTLKHQDMADLISFIRSK